MAGSRFFRNNTENRGMRKALFGSTDLKCLKINSSYCYNLLEVTVHLICTIFQFTVYCSIV